MSGKCILLTLVAAGSILDGRAALSDGLVACWQFNDRGGNRVRDAASGGFHGELQGGTWTNGQSFYDGALAFDGLGDRVTVPGSGAMPPSAIGSLAVGSIVLRFRFPETGSGDIIPILYFGESSSGSPHNSLIVEIGHGRNSANRRLYFTIVNARFCYDSGTNLPADVWHHFAAVVGPNGNTGYLNGQEMTARRYNLGSDATYTNFFSSVPAQELLSFGYGRYGQEDPFFYGPAVISDARLYNRPLTLDEVRQLQAESDDPGLLSVEAQGVAGTSSVILSWPGTTDYSYSVYESIGLPSVEWSPVAGWTDRPGVAGSNTATLPIGSDPFRCYRVTARR